MMAFKPHSTHYFLIKNIKIKYVCWSVGSPVVLVGMNGDARVNNAAYQNIFAIRQA